MRWSYSQTALLRRVFLLEFGECRIIFCLLPHSCESVWKEFFSSNAVDFTENIPGHRLSQLSLDICDLLESWAPKFITINPDNSHFGRDWTIDSFVIFGFDEKYELCNLWIINQRSDVWANLGLMHARYLFCVIVDRLFSAT